jgi:hypothetical protein
VTNNLGAFASWNGEIPADAESRAPVRADPHPPALSDSTGSLSIDTGADEVGTVKQRDTVDFARQQKANNVPMNESHFGQIDHRRGGRASQLRLDQINMLWQRVADEPEHRAVFS